VEKDTEYEKNAIRLLSLRLADFSWLRLDADKCLILPYLQEILYLEYTGVQIIQIK
jgi:hypothetical protein